jgi:hypothetical protein
MRPHYSRMLLWLKCYTQNSRVKRDCAGPIMIQATRLTKAARTKQEQRCATSIRRRIII